MSDPELLTVNQLAERLHIKPRTVQAWTLQGRIPAVKLSRKVVRYEWPAVLSALRGLSAQKEGAKRA